MKRLINFLTNETRAARVEYTMLITFLFLLVAGAAYVLGDNLKTLYGAIASQWPTQ